MRSLLRNIVSTTLRQNRRRAVTLAALGALSCEANQIIGLPTGDDGSGLSPQNDATSSSQGGDATLASETSSGGNEEPEAAPGADSPTDGDGASDGGALADGGDGAGDGATVTASCAGTMHPLCIDFESGKADVPWVLPASNAAVEQGNAAHGRYAMHLSNLHSIPKNGSGQPQIYLHAPMQGFKDRVWARFYLNVDPGAPDGHGVLVRVDDSQTNWDEVGFQNNAYFSDWHTGVVGNPERYEGSKVIIPQKKWTCVEFYLDGATPDFPMIWGDGAQVMLGNIGGPASTIQKAIQFVKFNVGIVFYHGGSLVAYGDDTPPYITDEWIDDVAVDTTRIGCL